MKNSEKNILLLLVTSSTNGSMRKSGNDSTNGKSTQLTISSDFKLGPPAKVLNINSEIAN